MQRSRLKNIANKSKEMMKPVVGEFEQFKNSLPIEIDDNYRLEAAWKAYGKPKNYQEALWEGLVQPIDDKTFKMPSIGYNEETEEYEYLNKGKENETVNRDIRVWDNDVIPFVKELKHGGYIRVYNDEKDCWTNKKGGKTNKNRSIEELIEYAKQQNPRFIQRMSEQFKDIEFIDDNGIKTRGTHYMVSDKDGLVFPSIQELEDGSLKFFENIDEARENAIKNNNFIKFNSEEEAENFAKNYKQGWPEFFGIVNINGKWFKKDGSDENGNRFIDNEGGLYYFKQGGQMNVIPEGALHARKNNMEGAGEDFTHKGIPVVDNDGEQQAEIERNEVIFNKDLTDFIESNYKKFKSEETKNSEKDEIAIKVGKRLVKELLTNTDDRTGLISEVEQKM